MSFNSIGDQGIERLAQTAHWSALDLQETALGEDASRFFSQMKQLTHLNLSGNRDWGNHGGFQPFFVRQGKIS